MNYNILQTASEILKIKIGLQETCNKENKTYAIVAEPNGSTALTPKSALRQPPRFHCPNNTK
jgi:hypothetical protein